MTNIPVSAAQGPVNYSEAMIAYVIGNIQSTQEPGYSYPNINSPMPDHIILEVYSPGNSSVSAYFAGYPLYNGSATIIDLQFSGHVQIYSVISQLDANMSITVSSGYANLSRTFEYRLNVMGEQEFISYENLLHPHTALPNINVGVVGLFAGAIYVALLAMGSAFVFLWTIPMLSRARSPDSYRK